MTNFPCVVIATALPVEFKAVLALLEECREERHEAGTIYWSGSARFDTQTGRVGLVQTGQRNPRAAFEIERAIGFFRPSHIFFVGVAGALKDVQVGDVVAATKVYDTEGGKADTVYRPRLDFGQSSYSMQQLAYASERSDTWRERIQRSPTYNGQIRPQPKAFVGPIASGENVVSSTDSDVYKFLKQQCSDALAIEMEGFGFLAAMHANEKVPALLVRGISDLIDNKNGADSTGSQEVASIHAAAFVMDILSRVRLPEREAEIGTTPSVSASSQTTPSGVTLSEDDFWRQLNALAARIYPRGPEDNDIWERAGGDLASIARHIQGRAAWFSALRTLKMGGGGVGLNVGRLFKAMSDDFPQNTELQRLQKGASHLWSAANHEWDISL